MFPVVAAWFVLIHYLDRARLRVTQERAIGLGTGSGPGGMELSHTQLASPNPGRTRSATVAPACASLANEPAGSGQGLIQPGRSLGQATVTRQESQTRNGNATARLFACCTRMLRYKKQGDLRSSGTSADRTGPRITSRMHTRVLTFACHARLHSLLTRNLGGSNRRNCSRQLAPRFAPPTAPGDSWGL